MPQQERNKLFCNRKKKKIPVTIRGVPHRSGRDWYFDVKLGEMSYMTRAEHDGIRD